METEYGDKVEEHHEMQTGVFFPKTDINEGIDDDETSKVIEFHRVSEPSYSATADES